MKTKHQLKLAATALPPVGINGLGCGAFSRTATRLAKSVFPQRFHRLELLQLL